MPQDRKHSSKIVTKLIVAAAFLFTAMGCLLPLTSSGAEKVKIGVIVPISGALTPFGKGALDGIKLRVEQINSSGGVNGKSIELIVEDSKGDKSQTISAFKKLTGIDRVVAVIGEVTSTNTLALANLAEKNQTPTITPTATNDKVTARGSHMFRACFNDSFQGKVVANYASTSKNFTKAAVITDLSSDYSKGLGNSFKEAFANGGGQIVAEESYQQKDTEFGAQLSKIKDSGAEVVFVPGYPPELQLIIKQAEVIGLGATFCGADGWDNDSVIENSGDKIIGSFIVGAFSPEDQRPEVQSFIKAFGGNAGTFEALGYDSVSILAEAMKKGVTRKAIKEGLFAIKDFPTVTGKTTILSNGDAIKSAVIMSVEKDKGGYFKKYQATINP